MICLTCRYPLGDGYQEKGTQKSDHIRTGSKRNDPREERRSGYLGSVQSGTQAATSGTEVRTIFKRSSSKGNRAAKVAALLGLSASLFGADPSNEARTVLVHKTDIVPVATHLRYSTLIELPEGEIIDGEACGDKDNWSVQDFTTNFVFVKPKGDKPGRDTNLYVYTKAGNLYGFLIREVSNDPKVRSDVKVIIQQGDEDAKTAALDVRSTLDARVAALSEQLATLQRERFASKETKPDETAVRDYKWPHDKTAERFGLRDIWHDSHFTHLTIDAQEAPALYGKTEDGKDALLQYTLKDGIYTVPRVLDAGYLRLGRAKLEFKREKGS